MLGDSTTKSRRFRHRMTLIWRAVVYDEFGHESFSEPKEVITVYGSARQMSATKTMMTFQQADVIGVTLEFRAVREYFNGVIWNGHEIHFAAVDPVDDRGRYVRVVGWYKTDNTMTE